MRYLKLVSKLKKVLEGVVVSKMQKNAKQNNNTKYKNGQENLMLAFSAAKGSELALGRDLPSTKTILLVYAQLRSRGALLPENICQKIKNKKSHRGAV